MNKQFTINENYLEMLLRHGVLSKKETSRKTDEYARLQKELLAIEKKMTSADIIAHAELAFPKVHED